MLRDGWAIACMAGLWGWIVSTACFIVAAFPSRDVFAKVPALRWGALVVLFFSLWIAGMVNA